MWSEIVGIYRASKKQRDINWFTEWVARPPAAAVVYLLRGTPVTPNQVTFLSAVGAQVAVALERAQLYDAVNAQRLRLERELEMARARRYVRSLTVIVIAGTLPPRFEVAAAVREVDLVVQVGGRLILALPETDRPGGDETRRRLVVLFPGATLRLATFPEDGKDVAALLAAAN